MASVQVCRWEGPRRVHVGAPALAEARCLEAGLGVPGPQEQEQRSRSKALQMQSLSERVHNVQAGPADWFCEVTTAQCTDCQCREIWASVGKRQERL